MSTLPTSSSSKRYLTGIDWTIGTLEHITRQQTGVGNLSQVVLDLDGILPLERLRDVLKLVAARFPLIFGRVGRSRLNLAPLWLVPDRPGTIPLRLIQLPHDADTDHLFADHVNSPLSGHSQHLRFLLVHLGSRASRLGLVFDHRLLDAFGAEAFLHLLDLAWHGKLEEIAPQVSVTEPAHRDNWAARFEAGRAITQRLREVQSGEIVALPMPPRQTPREVRFVHASLSPQATDAFIQRADEEAGIPALLPSAVARALAAMHGAFAGTSLPGEQYVTAVSVDTRAPDTKWRNLFFNHLSFLWFAVPTRLALSLADSVPLLRDQLFEQMRADVPAALESVTMLARICPHWLMAKMPGLPFKGRSCSFYFACLRGSGFESESFLGLPVANLIHTPRIPPPPGVGIGLTFHAGRLNIVLSYLKDVLTDVAANDVVRRLKRMMNAEG
jgi:hypothetical protein